MKKAPLSVLLSLVALFGCSTPQGNSVTIAIINISLVGAPPNERVIIRYSTPPTVFVYLEKKLTIGETFKNITLKSISTTPRVASHEGFRAGVLVNRVTFENIHTGKTIVFEDDGSRQNWRIL